MQCSTRKPFVRGRSIRNVGVRKGSGASREIGRGVEVWALIVDLCVAAIVDLAVIVIVIVEIVEEIVCSCEWGLRLDALFYC